MSARTVEVDDLAEIRSALSRAPDAELLFPIGLREVTTGGGGVATIHEVLERLDVARGAQVAVLTDDTPKQGAHGAVIDELCSIAETRQAVTTIVLHPRPGDIVHADEATIAGALERLRAESPVALVTVGSGTIADIGKVLAAKLDLPHVVVQSAASVNGYADDQSVLLLKGVKRTTPSRWPDALVVDPDVVSRAPAQMTRAGLGDQLSMFTAAADWYLASAVGFDTSYSDTAVRLLRDAADGLLDRAAAIGAGDPDAIEHLARALTAGGLAMGIAGRTAPSSGSEHAISHLLEMHAASRQEISASHGSQVGVGSVVAARLWARVRSILRSGPVVVSSLDEERMHGRVEAAFDRLDDTGATAEECWTAYRRKLQWINDNLDSIQSVCDAWAHHDRVLADLLQTPAATASALDLAGAPSTFRDLEPVPTSETVRWAVGHAHLQRDRFGVIDLAEVLGLWDADEVDALIRGAHGGQR